MNGNLMGNKDSSPACLLAKVSLARSVVLVTTPLEPAPSLILIPPPIEIKDVREGSELVGITAGFWIHFTLMRS